MTDDFTVSYGISRANETLEWMEEAQLWKCPECTATTTDPLLDRHDRPICKECLKEDILAHFEPTHMERVPDDG